MSWNMPDNLLRIFGAVSLLAVIDSYSHALLFDSLAAFAEHDALLLRATLDRYE